MLETRRRSSRGKKPAGSALIIEGKFRVVGKNRRQLQLSHEIEVSRLNDKKKIFPREKELMEFELSHGLRPNS